MSNAGLCLKPMSIYNIECITANYLNTYCKDHLDNPNNLDVEKLLEISLNNSHSIEVDLVENIGNNAEACYVPAKNQILLTNSVYEGMSEGVGRSRFTVAHEIGHVLLHKDQLNNLQLNRLIPTNDTDKVFCDSEWQADVAAGALLIPAKNIKPLFYKLYREGFSVEGILMTMVEIYNVSMSCAKRRLEILKLIDNRKSKGK